MRRSIAAALPLSSLVLLSLSPAQTSRRPHPATQREVVAKPSELPITRVALYKNGVGFFEHAGRVTGDGQVTIDFTSAQLNNVLQTLTAIDLGGGRISGAGYNSTTPLEQQLRALPLGLGASVTDVDFFNAIRGARVAVSGPGGAITGRVLSLDLRGAVPKKDGAEEAPGERRFLTVIADSGAVKTFEITPATTVTVLDGALHGDITRYLELIAANRNEGLRHLTLVDRGNGTRELHVSYISEVPVWKSTYRILFTDAVTAGTPNQTATLQGWSVVDNTTGSDWVNVHLDLIAGAPQSFIQPLSTPYYTRRPEIPLPAEAQLSPQTHESGEELESAKVAPAPAPPSAQADTISVAADGMTSTTVSGLNVLAAKERSMRGEMKGSYKNWQEQAQASFATQATTSAFDDYFQYALTDPITIRKNESALVPILQTRLPVERVTLWSQREPVALRALWITNASNLTLDRGSFSIVENGAFGGEGLLDPIHPNERRLLSYAADQAIRVTTGNSRSERRVQRITIRKGVLTETSTDTSELTYDVRNVAPDARIVVIEHPVRAGYTLDSVANPKSPDPKPAETTPSVYRFRVAAPAAQTAHLHLLERHTNYEFIRLVDRSEEQLVLLLRNDKASPELIAKLQPAFDAHAVVVDLDGQIRTRDAEVAAITKDQDRLRENLKALKGSAEERALVARYSGELNAQEDRLAVLRRELADLHTRRAAADADFQAKLDAIDLDETL